MSRSNNVKIIIRGDSSSAEAAFRRASSAAKNSAKIIGTAGLAIAIAFEKSAIKAVGEFEQSLADLSAITGATGKNLAYLSAQARDIGKTTTLSASQAAEAFKLMASAKPDLLENAAALAAVTKQAVKLSEASGIALPESASILGISLNQMGADADQAGRFINVLAAGAKFGASEIASTAAAMRIVGTVARSSSVSFEELNAAIQSMAFAGLKGQEAGTGLRGVLLKLENQTNAQFKPSVVGLSNAIKNLRDAHLDSAAKTKLFGLESITAANALTLQADKLPGLIDKLTGTATATEQARTRMNTMMNDMKRMENAFESLQLAVTSTAPFRSFIQETTDAIAGLEIFINKITNAPDQLALAVKIADVTEEIKRGKKGLADYQKQFFHPFAALGFDPVAHMVENLQAAENKLRILTAQRQKLLQAPTPTGVPSSAPPTGVPSSATPTGVPSSAPPTGVPSSATPTPQPSGPSPAVLKAMADAKKIIDIHSAKFRQIQILGQAAFADEQDRLLAKQDADIAALDAEQQRMRDAAAAQGASKAEISNLNDYYDQLKIDRAQQTADAISSIDQKSAAKQAQITKAAGDAKLALAEQSMGAISSLLAGHGKKAFALSKVFAIGQTVISTYSAAQKAYESQMAIPDPSAPSRAALAAGIAVAQGVARVSAIASTSYGSSSVSASAGGSTTPGGLATQGGFGGAAQRVPFNPTQHPTTPGTGGGTVIQITQHITAPNSQPGQEQAIAAAAQIATHQALAAVNQDFSTNGPLRQQLAV